MGKPCLMLHEHLALKHGTVLLYLVARTPAVGKPNSAVIDDLEGRLIASAAATSS